MSPAPMTSISTTSSRKRRAKYVIYLLNDEFNSFEHIIKVLTTFIPHCNASRAESIAMITHTTGKCDIIRVYEPDHVVIFAQLLKAGLTIKIERA
jgi:ATP-dependent Clp protease adapter protein ClpS